MNQEPRIYGPEEIDILLNGDRREIDRLLLTSLNALAFAFLRFRDSEFRPHIIQELAMTEALGEPKDVERRRKWLDAQIARESDLAILRKKVITSTAIWAVPLIIVFTVGLLATGVRERLASWLNTDHTSVERHK